MTVITEKFTIQTNGFDDLIDITNKIANFVSLSNIKDGVLTVSVVGGCASVVTFEEEPGLSFDIARLLDAIVPINKIYQHDVSWHEGNAHAHLKAIMLGNSKTFSIKENRLQIAEFQKIALIDFDNKHSLRQLIVSVVY